MSVSFAALVRPFAVLLAFAAGPALHAQSLTGPLSDDTTGPVTPGVHQVIGAISIPTGKTLTIQAGAILKFLPGTQFAPSGTLIVNGTTPSPAIFTSINDDTAGGDTNGNGGSTVPAGGDWTGIIFNAGSEASALTHADIRYGGAGGWANVYLNGGLGLTLTSCVIRNCSQPGCNVTNSAALLTVTGCTFTNNLGAAVENLRLDAVPGFANNTASGNIGNYMHISNGTVGTPLTIGPANCLNGALVINTSVSLNAPVTLNAGTVLKMQGPPQIVNASTLHVNGTAGNPVVLTSIKDDSVAGDTNGDGAGSLPAPGDWSGLIFNTGSGASIVNHADIRYGGAGGWADVYFNGSGINIALTNSTLRNCSGPGLNATNSVSLPTVTNCAFTSNGGPAVENLRLDSVAGFSGNSATGNVGNFLHILEATVTAPLVIGPANYPNGALVIDAPFTVNAPLTVNAGTVFKFQGAQPVVVASTLLMDGTAASPVVFTSLDDDTAGGDTNGNGGATSPVAGSWSGLIFNPGSGASVVDNADIRYGGVGGWANVYINSAGLNITLTNSTSRNCSTVGFNATNSSFAPTVSGCTFTSNAGVAVDNVRLDTVAGFSNNFAAANGGNYIRITEGTVSSDMTLQQANCLRGALVMATGITVTSTGTLHLLPGFHVKMSTGLLAVNGALDIEGDSTAPVIFTSFKDDTIDGDTNGDLGATAPAQGDWSGVEVSAAAGASTVRHLRSRYAGAGGWAGLWNDSPLCSIHVVRSDHSSASGIALSAAAGTATDLAAWDCTNDGILLNGGGPLTISRCTAANNGIAGIHRVLSLATVRNSIAWGNTGPGGNFSNFAAGSVFFSDGSPTLAGSNGNTNVDPKFVNAATGDLTLQKTSPCIDSGDPAETATGTDDALYPRFMDGNLDKVRIIDRGAYEFDNVHLAVTGTPTPGGTLTVATTGTAGLTSYLFIGVLPAEGVFKQFGPLFENLAAPYVLLPWVATPSSVPLSIPASVPVPLPVIFQELGILGATGASPGNLSNPVYLTIK
jgi:hypothetical protein